MGEKHGRTPSLKEVFFAGTTIQHDTQDSGNLNFKKNN